MLAASLGEESVFIDVDALRPGEDFMEVIEEVVSKCDIALVVIGRHWLAAADSKGRRRLDRPNDPVATEVAAALARGIRVIPVLVEGAEMPDEEELPLALKPLSRRHALELGPTTFRRDVDRLVASIQQPDAQPRGPRRGPARAAQAEAAAGEAVPPAEVLDPAASGDWSPALVILSACLTLGGVALWTWGEITWVYSSWRLDSAIWGFGLLMSILVGSALVSLARCRSRNAGLYILLGCGLVQAPGTARLIMDSLQTQDAEGVGPLLAGRSLVVTAAAVAVAIVVSVERPWKRAPDRRTVIMAALSALLIGVTWMLPWTDIAGEICCGVTQADVVGNSILVESALAVAVAVTICWLAIRVEWRFGAGSTAAGAAGALFALALGIAEELRSLGEEMLAGPTVGYWGLWISAGSLLGLAFHLMRIGDGETSTGP